MPRISDAQERMAKRGILKLQSDAKAFSRYEQELFNIIMNRGTDYFDADARREMDESEDAYKNAYRQKIDELAFHVDLLLELLDLDSMREGLSKDLKDIKSREDGSYKIDFDPHNDDFHCEGRDRVIRSLEGIGICFYEEPKAKESPVAIRIDLGSAEKQRRLKELLKGTAHWVSVEAEKLKRPPSKENHIQTAMRTILQSNFSDDYIEKISVPHYVKNFKPDGGVQSIRTAIEYKFIDSDEELAKATGAVFEDMIGYGSSREWEFFYSVFYMTSSFKDPVALEKSLATKGNGKWHPIVLVGNGGRGRKRKQSEELD